MALYPAPRQVLPTYNPTALNISPNGKTNIDQAFLDANYLKFPQAQGTENFGSILVASDETINGNIIMNGTSNINYIQFPDGSKQFSSPTDDINTVYNDVSNTFLSPYIQTFQGSNTTSNTTAPFKISNITSGDYGTLYIDPSPYNDLTLYSNQNNGGLTVRSPNSSFTFNPYPIASGIVGCQTLNPIDMNGQYLYGLTNVYADSSGMTFIDSSNAPLLQLTNGGHTSYENINMNYNDISNINNIYFGGNNCSISNQNDFNPNIINIANLSPYTNSPLIYFQMLNSSGIAFSPLNIAYNNINIDSRLFSFVNTNIEMDTYSNIFGTQGGFNEIGFFDLVNCTATTQPLNTNNTSIATCEFVLANQGTPTDLTNYAQKTYPTLQTFTGPITFTGTVNSNAYNINTYSVIDQSGTNNGTVISNNAPYVGGAQATIGFNLNSPTGSYTPFKIYSNGLNSLVDLNMNNANINGINTLTGYNGGNITLGSYINMNSNNILSMGSASTAYTQPLGTNNTTIATTAFVNQIAPTYTQSSFTLASTSPQYYSMSPSPVSVISTYTSGNNTASFNSVPFVLTCLVSATFLQFTLNFNTAPFPNYPPPSTLNMTVNCSTGVTYTCVVSFNSSNQAFCILSNGGVVNVGTTYTCNLSTIGAFNP